MLPGFTLLISARNLTVPDDVRRLDDLTDRAWDGGRINAGLSTQQAVITGSSLITAPVADAMPCPYRPFYLC
jgi:hypothetical protein